MTSGVLETPGERAQAPPSRSVTSTTARRKASSRWVSTSTCMCASHIECVFGWEMPAVIPSLTARFRLDLATAVGSGSGAKPGYHSARRRGGPHVKHDGVRRRRHRRGRARRAVPRSGTARALQSLASRPPSYPRDRRSLRPPHSRGNGGVRARATTSRTREDPRAP